MYIRIYVLTYMFPHISINMYMHACMLVCMYACRYIHTHKLNMGTCICTLIFIFIFMLVFFICMCISLHAYIVSFLCVFLLFFRIALHRCCHGFFGSSLVWSPESGLRYGVEPIYGPIKSKTARDPSKGQLIYPGRTPPANVLTLNRLKRCGHEGLARSVLLRIHKSYMSPIGSFKGVWVDVRHV